MATGQEHLAGRSVGPDAWKTGLGKISDQITDLNVRIV
jgi:hypothetical protein